MIDRMRVLEICMILGFLSSVIAQEQTDNIGPPSNRSDISGLSFEQLRRLQKAKCEKNGGPTAYNTLTEGMWNFPKCIGSLVNVTELSADRAAAGSEGRWDKFVDKYCQKVPNLMQCFGHFTDSMKPCQDAEDREILESRYNISSLYLEFMCQNNGSRLESFLSTGGTECLSSKAETIVQDCHLESPANKPRAESVGRSLWWLEVLEKDCPVLERFGTCTVGVLRTCDNPTPANVIESVFHLFKSRKSCSSISPTQPSPAE